LRTVKEGEKVGRKFQFSLQFLTPKSKPHFIITPKKSIIHFIIARLPKFRQNFTFFAVDQYGNLPFYLLIYYLVVFTVHATTTTATTTTTTTTTKFADKHTNKTCTAIITQYYYIH